MSTSFFDEVLFNDGEGVDFNDLNNLARMVKAPLYDAVLGALWGQDLDLNTDAVAADNTVVCVPTFAHAIPKPGGSNLQVVSGQGTLFQCLQGAIGGNSQQFIPYYLAASEISVTLDAGDGSHPRIDLIQIQLTPNNAGSSTSRDFIDATTRVITTNTENKTNRTSLTVSVKKGTPAASPTKPTPDLGFACWCFVYVPTAFNSTFTATTHFIDVRMPMRVRSQFITFTQMKYLTGWTLDTWGGAIDGSGSNPVVAHPAMGQHQRLLGVELYSTLSGSGSTVLQRLDYDNGGGAVAATALTAPIPSTSFVLANNTRTLFNSRDALWGNGYCSPNRNTPTDKQVALLFTTNSSANDRVKGARFIIAG